MSKMSVRDWFAMQASEADIERHMPTTIGETYELLVKLGWIKPMRPGDHIHKSYSNADTMRLRAWARYQHADLMMLARESAE